MSDDYLETPLDLSKIPLSPTKQAGDLVFISGQLPFDENMEIISGGVAEQTVQTMKNIEKLLKGHGCTFANVVKMNIFLVPGSSFQEFNETYASFFEPGNCPARTTVTSELLMPGAVIEIEGVAQIPNG